MLPTNPRPSARGLPSRPRQRSRSSNRNASRYETQDPSNSAPQNNEPSRPPPLPTSRQEPRGGVDSSYDERDRPRQPPSRYSNASTISYTASSTSSRSRGQTGYASSRTSLEEDARPTNPQGGSHHGDGRRRGYDTSPIEDDNDPEEKVPAGFGFAIWDHVANVASNLTVNVSKAWATNITSEDGEATPEGQESRLTRAMKAYHLEKARDPSDLPAWLFDERERRAKNSTRGRQEFVDDEPEPLAAPPAQSSGLRAIYASAAAATPVKKPRQDPTYYGEAPSRAADRLKALRDAKRGIMRAASVSDEQPVSRMPSSEPPRPARVGLPSGPMGSRRR